MSHHRYVPTATGAGDPRIPIAAVLNENWRGKNDPTERRRIQNRLNQRAFRQRQRAGESPKPYKPRSMSAHSSSPPVHDEEDDEEDDDDGDHKAAYNADNGVDQDEDEESDDDDDDDDDDKSESAAAREQQVYSPRPANGSRSTSSHAVQQVTGGPEVAQARGWDELAQVIHHNFLTAAVSNARHLGIDPRALRDGALILTPQASTSNQRIPTSLIPVPLQYQVAHDPIIDIIPHPQLRHNVLYAIATRALDPTVFVRCVRSSGSQQELHGSYQRGGLVVWSSPEQISSWELTEGFIRRYATLLAGCDDVLAATNVWRVQRGERAFAFASRT